MPETAIRFHGGIRDGTDEQVYAERTAGRWAFSWLQLGSSLGVGLPRRDTMAAGERDDHRSDSGPLRDVSGVFTKSDFKIDPSQLQFFGTSATSYRVLVRGVDIDVLIGK